MTSRILVVDDEPDLEDLVVQRFRRNIRKGEYEFKFARDGVEALEVLEADPGIDIVFAGVDEFTTKPVDFDDFWSGVLEHAAEIPLNPRTAIDPPGVHVEAPVRVDIAVHHAVGEQAGIARVELAIAAHFTSRSHGEHSVASPSPLQRYRRIAHVAGHRQYRR